MDTETLKPPTAMEYVTQAGNRLAHKKLIVIFFGMKYLAGMNPSPTYILIMVIAGLMTILLGDYIETLKPKKQEPQP